MYIGLSTEQKLLSTRQNNPDYKWCRSGIQTIVGTVDLDSIITVAVQQTISVRPY